MGFLMLVVPRRDAILPLLLVVCFLTLGQRVVIFSLDFTMLRVMVIFCWLRLILRKEFVGFELNSIDCAIIWWVAWSTFAYSLHWLTIEAVINRFGQAYNTFGLYFGFRLLIRDWDDIKGAMRFLAIVLVPIAFFMLLEKQTGRNVFAVFGGVPEFTFIRDGSLRSQGPFTHPILAGAFGATAVPLFFALYWQGAPYRKWAKVGFFCSTFIAFASASGTPIMSYLFGILGLLAWPLRGHMKTVRRGLVMSILGLQLVMKAPVWFLFDRIDEFTGGSGWHRSYLIDRTVHNFFEWWLIGVKDTAHWGYLMMDVTNQYIRYGVDGGLLSLILFIVIIVRCFRSLGLALSESIRENALFKVRILFWALGASLFSHLVTFLATSYFDQIIVSWLLLLAIIATVAPTNKATMSQHQALKQTVSDNRVFVGLS